MPQSAAAKAAEENRRKKATDDARKRATAEKAKKSERVKDDDVRKEPTYKPPAKSDAINRQAPVPSYAKPAENKVFIPTWRSNAPPPGASTPRSGGADRYEPPPSNTPAWRSSAPPGQTSQFGDREALDAPPPRLQVGLTSPRPDTGPVGLGSSQPTAPTATTPSVQPWRPPRWNMQEERDAKLGAPSPTWNRKPEGPPVPDALQPQGMGFGWMDPNRPPEAAPRPYTQPDQGIGETWSNATRFFRDGFGDAARGAGGWFGDYTEKRDANIASGNPLNAPMSTKPITDRWNEASQAGDEYYNQYVKEQGVKDSSDIGLSPLIERGFNWLDKETTRPTYNVKIPGTDALFGSEVSPGQLLQSANAGMGAANGKGSTTDPRDMLNYLGLEFNPQTAGVEFAPQAMKDKWAGLFSAERAANANADTVSYLGLKLNPKTMGVEFDPTLAKDKWMGVAAAVMHPIAALQGTEFVQGFQSNIEQSIAVRKQIESLPPEQKAAGTLALYNLISGPQAMQQTLADQINKPAKIEELAKQARDAKAAGDDLAAAKIGAQIAQLRNQTALDVVNANQDPWMEIAGGMLLDPTNLLPIGSMIDAAKAYKTAKIYNISAEQGIKNLDTAIASANKILGNATPVSNATMDAYKLAGDTVTAAKKAAMPAPGSVVDIRKWYEDWWNPMARTAQTKAAMSTSTLWQTATQMIGQAADKAEAQRILATWVDNPQALIEQMGFGPGMVANKYVTEQMPILKAAGEKLKTLASLAGEGQYVAADVASELEGVLTSASRSLFGLQPLDLPPGAVNFRLKRDGVTGFIEYVDKAGKVISQTAPDVLANAADQYKNMRKAVGAAQSSGLLKALDWQAGIQKSFMADMFLNRPSYHLRNVSAAMAGLIPDKNYSWKTTEAITGWWGKKLGGFGANLRSNAEMAGQAAQSNWTRQFWPKANPYATAMETIQKVPALLEKMMGGYVPVREEKLYLNAMDAAGQRAFRSGWGDTVTKEITPILTSLGIQPDLVQHIAKNLLSAGVDGSKADVLTAIRTLAGKKTIPFTLEHLGIPPEVLGLENWAKLNQIFADVLPEQADSATAAVREIFSAENGRYAATLLDDPQQPVVYEWTKQALQQDGADIIDAMTEAAKRTGGDPTAAAQQGQQVAQQFTEATTQAWDGFRNELAQATNPNAAAMATDVWVEYRKIMDATRAQADTLAKAAKNAPTKEARAALWQAHQEAVPQLWQQAGNQIGELFQNTRAQLLQGGEYTPKNSWQDIVKRYVSYDDAEIAVRRAQGSGLTSTTAQGDTFEQVIAANRTFVDKSMLELFEAYKRAPSPENYDLMVESVRKFEQYGAQVRQYLKPFKEDALLKNTDAAWKKYYATRNQAWAQGFDNAVLYNNVNKRIMVANGVGQQVASGLQWTDEFAGGTFKLVGPDGKGGWQALNDAGEIVNFADPKAMKEAGAGGVAVPQNIINDFHQAIGQSEKIVDDVLTDIAQSAPKPDTTASMNIGDIVWRGPQGDKPVSVQLTGEVDGVPQYLIEETGQTVPETELYEYAQGMKLRSLADAETMRVASETAQTAPDQAAAAKEAMATMRTEWDRIARGGRGYLKLENAAGLYVKDGIARVPENKFEDLYGVTIAGQQIESSADVEALLEDYARMKRQASGLQAAGQQAQAEYVQAYNNLQTFREANPYTVNPANTLDLHGAGANTNLYEQVAADTAESLRQGGGTTPTMSSIANHQLDQLKQAEAKILAQLPQILQGTPNTLTPGQAVQLVEKIQGVLPSYDNVMAMAARAGQDAADFAMLNYGDKRNIDTILAMVMPYHYYLSRTPRNWAIRTAKRPAIARFWYNSQRAINQENEQADLPTRMQGSVPNPTGIGPERISNPLNFMLPFYNYMPREDDQQDAPTEFERWARPVLDQSFPLVQYGADAALDYYSPLPNGKKRTDKYQLGDYVPLYRMAGSIKQAITGENIGSGALAAGDEWDQYRTARQVPVDMVQGDVAKITGTDDVKANQVYSFYANQIAVNKSKGLPDGENIPPEYLDMANKIYLEASKRVGADQARAQIMSWTLGVTGHDVQPGEQELRGDSAQYNQLGYGPENPYGSKAAKDDFLAEKPGVGVWWSKNATVPGSTSTLPAASAQTGQAKDLSTAIYDAQTAAKDAFILANPNAKKDAVYQAGVQAAIAEARKHVDPAKLDEFLKTNPGATAGDIAKFIQSSELPLAYQFGDSGNTANDPYKGMNPAERQQAQMEAAFKEAGDLPRPEWPGDTASKEAKSAYYKAMDKYEADRLAFATNKLMTSGDAERGRLELTPEQIEKAYTDYQNRNKSETEVAFNAKKDAEAAAGSAAWAAKRASVTDAFGAGGAALWQQYMDLPKGSDARDKFMAEHPEIKAMNMLAYNPNEYSQAQKLFGDDAWTAWASAPAWADNDEAKAARSAYFAEHPEAKLLNAWVQGRRGESVYDPTKPPDYDFGKDYAEAQKLFGDGIWDTFAQYDSRWGKAQKRAFYDQHPEYGDFTDWWYGDDGKEPFVKRSSPYSRGGRGGGGGGGGGKRKGGKGGYWFGNWYIDENGIPHWGGPDGPLEAPPGAEEAMTSGEEPPPASKTSATDAKLPPGIVDPGFSRDGARRPVETAPTGAGVDPGFSQDGVRRTEGKPAAEKPPAKGEKPASEGQSLMENIAKYRAMAREDPYNDWLTHLPKEVAAQELALALSGGSGGGNYQKKQPQIDMPQARYLDRELQLSDQNIRPWRPQNIDYGFMSAGRELQPDKIQPWRPRKW